MKENRISKTFGPVGSFAGIMIFFLGLSATILFNDGRIAGFLVGILTTLTGAFIGFSNSSVLIDQKKKRVRFSNNIFGFIRTGVWMDIEPDMKIGITASKMNIRSYSRGNRILDIPVKKFIVMLFDKESKPIATLGISNFKDQAIKEAEILSENLKIKYN
jgi:hypothetical protein